VARGPLLIGRAPDCDLVLHHDSVSRHHARISRSRDGWRISDLRSKNGVKVNNCKAARARLDDGDRIDLGAMRIYVSIGPAPDTTPTRVIFEESRDPLAHSHRIDMEELYSLISRNGCGADVSRTALAAEEIERAGKALASLFERDGDEAGRDADLAVERVGLLRLFSEASEALLTGESLDEILDRILALVFRNLPAERGVICLYDEQTDTREPKVMRTLEGVPDEPIVISSNIVNEVLQRRQSLLVRDTELDERFAAADSVAAMRIRTAICAPLYRDGRVVGFIYVDRQGPKRPFEIEHLQTLSTLAVLSAVAVEQASLRDEVRRERQIRARLSRYSSPALVERLIQTPGLSKPGMAADESEVSVLFGDFAGFTAMAECMAPAEVVRLLNHAFERLTETVFDLDGTLDKFRGDGMMAFFGAPLPLSDHAERAVEAALRMLEMLEEINQYAPASQRLAMRIGINSGPAVVGDIGSSQRKDYTVIGDTVNIASHLESFVALPGQVVIGHETHTRLGDRFRCRSLEEVHLKGKRQVVHPHLVLGRREPREVG
jgi:adenylate cyclase